MTIVNIADWWRAGTATYLEMAKREIWAPLVALVGTTKGLRKSHPGM
jgi:hypothetical protein